MKSTQSIVAFLTASLCFAVAIEDGSQSNPESPSGKSGALQALEFWTSARAYPGKDIPEDKYFKAALHMKRSMRSLDRIMGTDSIWSFLGPTNFSGRMTCIAINPLNVNTIYAGGASGGLWRSHTGGVGGDWHRVTLGFPVLGVNAIAIDPTDTNIIFIGTGEVYRYQGSVGGITIRTTRGSFGMGILKSTDAGSTWAQSLDWSYNQRRGVQAIRMNPQNPRTLFAATSEGVYQTFDAGTTWDPVLEVLMARDLAVNPIDTNLVLATCGNFATPGHGVYRSTDGGSTFSLDLTLPTFSGMAVLGTYAANPQRVYVHLAESTTVVGKFYRSTDFGENWVLINTSNSGDVQGWYSRFVAVHPTDSSRIVLGAQGMWRSTNGGTSFSGVSGGWSDYHNFAHHPTSPGILYMVDDGGVWRSTNFGVSFDFIGNGLETSQFYNGFSSSASDSMIALGQVQDHFGWMYTGSSNWVDGGVDEVGWTAIDQSNDFIMYAGDRGGGGVYKSTNRGLSYNWAGSGIVGGSSCWNAPFVLSSSNPSVLYFGRSIIFKTVDAAVSWSATNGGAELDGNPAICMAMSSTSTETVYVGTAPLFDRSHVFRTKNGGTAWDDITGPLPNRYPMDIAVDPTNSSTVYIAYGGFDTSHVFKSTTGGDTWIDITANLPDVPATALVVDPQSPGIVYAGTDIGTFVSTNGGTEWLTWGEGLPEAAIISDLSLSPSNRGIRAVTHSNGVYERTMLPPITTSVTEAEYQPASFMLGQNYPNPFNPLTTIDFTIHQPSHVSLTVYDLVGREVAIVVNAWMDRGSHRRTFDARALASGVYYYTLASGGSEITRKMVLAR